MKKWLEPQTEWLKAHSDATDVKGLFAEFCKAFPDFNTTISGFKNARYLLGIRAKPGTTHARHKPIGSELKKKGMWRIKVAEPSVWIQKQKYVYEQYHHVTLPKWTNVIFLDQDHENFDINNLYALDKSVIGILNGCFPLVKGDPEGNLTRIKQAELKYQMHQLGRKTGLCDKYGVFKDKARIDGRKYYYSMTEEQKEQAKKTRQRYFEKKRQDPEWRRKTLERQHKWYLEHKAKKAEE